MKRVGIIGAGASGLVCAIEAARKGHSVCVFEKNSKIGRKILATGNGKCNITNQTIKIERYHGEAVHHLKELFKRFDTKEAQHFFRTLGLEMREGENGRLYPMSHQASSVVDLLVHEARVLGVSFLVEHEVTSIRPKDGHFELEAKEQKHPFDACVIATGSPAMPALGSTNHGYTFARSFGHSVHEAYPSLVQLVAHESFLKDASGVKVDAFVELFVDQHKEQSVQGDVLFTPYGLSGSAILDVSRKASKALMEGSMVHVMVDLFPTLSKEALEGLFQKRLAYAKKKSLLLWLEGMVPKKLALFIIQKEKLGHISDAGELNAKEIKRLVYGLKALKVGITDTKGIESAEVCAGGVNVDELDSKTLMSKKVNGLYFCGEVLDVDGDCGGFNLHFAWASGHCVGRSL